VAFVAVWFVVIAGSGFSLWMTERPLQLLGNPRNLRSGRFVVLILIVLAATGCFRPHYIRTNPSSRGPSPEFNGLTEHVVLVSVDGLRPDAIAPSETPMLSRLIREGSYTLFAATILPSKTLPSHTSMLTGQPPDVHGVSWNTNVGLKRRNVQVPTVFEVLRDQGYVTAAFFSKSKFASLQRPGSLDYSQAPGGWFGYWSADRTVSDIESYLEAAQPHLLFVHLGDPDHAGHASGWMSPKYGDAVQHVDTAIAKLFAVAEKSFGTGRFTMIVTADHGGHDRDHGSSDPRDVTIPWIAWGRGVSAAVLARPVETFDTAPTVLWLLGVPEPTAWAGSPVTEAFLATNPE
jgi:predicted AlkP superfamily pyrophosphatase or phosphodiesterase